LHNNKDGPALNKGVLAVQTELLAVIFVVLLAITVLPAVAVVLGGAVGLVVWFVHRPDHAAPAEGFTAGIMAGLAIYAILLALLTFVFPLIA
jgi:nitrate reductase NapE component